MITTLGLLMIAMALVAFAPLVAIVSFFLVGLATAFIAAGVLLGAALCILILVQGSIPCSTN